MEENKPYIPEQLTFVFLCGSKDRKGFFVTEEQFHFLEEYFAAREKGGTWCDLYKSLSDFGKEFVSDFYEAEQYWPRDEEEMVQSDSDSNDASGPYDHLEPWVFSDHDFPVIQCATETYENYRRIFPEKLEQGCLMAEFGMPVGLYPRYRIPEISEHLATAGHKLLVRLFNWNVNMQSA